MLEKTENGTIVQPIQLGHVNIYLIKTDIGFVLVDTGMPNSNKKLNEAFQRYGVDPKDVQLIILTHGHLDHVGSTAYIKQITGGKMLCHRSFAKGLADGKIETAIPQNLLGRILNFWTDFLGSKIKAVKPDIVVDDEFDLSEFGVSGKVIYTPGHSQSSLSILLNNGEVLVGDLIREEKPGVIGLGMFYEDKDTALESVKKIASYDPKIIYLSHSTTIDYKMLDEFIATFQ